jgi:hypothetical protein
VSVTGLCEDLLLVCGSVPTEATGIIEHER